MSEPLLVAKAGTLQLSLLPALANRHGLITGATGTGKTVTLQMIAEQFSSIGVPVFMADVKGDLSGLARRPAEPTPRSRSAPTHLGIELHYEAFPVVFWDVFGERGHPIRATVSDLGPLLLARLLQSERHAGRRSEHHRSRSPTMTGCLLLDLKDLRAMLQHVGDHAARVHDRVRQRLGGVDRRDSARPARAGNSRAASEFFGEPMLNIDDLHADRATAAASSTFSPPTGS